MMRRAFPHILGFVEMAVPNPWTAEHWSLTAQGEYVKRFGLSVSQRTARLAGSAIGALRPNEDKTRIIERRWIIQKKVGGGGGSQGFEGSGPPS